MKLFKLFSIPVVIILLSWIDATSQIMVTQEMYLKLCGVWETSKDDDFDSKETLSWGEADINTNYSTIIDLGGDNPLFYTGGMGTFKITNIKKISEEKFSIEILFRDNKKYALDIYYVEKDIIRFNEMKWFSEIKFLWSGYGEKNLYYRHSKPRIQFYQPKVKNLRLRVSESEKSEVIRLLDVKEKLLIIKTGKKEKIKNINGNWVKVISDNNDIGWCFNAYLESTSATN